MNETGQDALFKGVGFDPRLYAETMKKPAPHTTYVIYFTPRSGSSWLTDVLVQTNRMSLANEVFNPQFMPRIAHAVNAANLDQYINTLQRNHSSNGVYGFEITWHQLNTIFPAHADFIARFGTGPAFWLIRRDIVAQAVSLAKMVTTRIAHTFTAADTGADDLFPYDHAAIKYWLLHILAAERGTEDLFTRYGITPLRLCYESMMAVGAAGIARIMQTHVGVTPVPGTSYDIRRAILATAQNAAYAERFRRDSARFLRQVEAERAVWLGQLRDLQSIA